MARARWLRTDEYEEAVRSLEWAEAQALSLEADPYAWKWVLIAMHNVAQGFMVLRDKIAAKWLEAYRNDGHFPVEKLDEFLNLYKKVKDANNFHTVGAGPFSPGSTHDQTFKRLNSFRNEFIH